MLNEGERSESNGIRLLRGCFLYRVRTGPSLDVGVNRCERPSLAVMLPSMPLTFFMLLMNACG